MSKSREWPQFNFFLSFIQLDDVRSAINYTVEALKVGKHITFLFFPLNI